MALEWMEAVLTKIENETPNTKRFYFEIPSLEKFDFIPGQFVTLDLPIHAWFKLNPGHLEKHNFRIFQNRLIPELSKDQRIRYKDI